MKIWWLYVALFVLYSVQIVLATLRLAAVILWPWYWIALPVGDCANRSGSRVDLVPNRFLGDGQTRALMK